MDLGLLFDLKPYLPHQRMVLAFAGSAVKKNNGKLSETTKIGVSVNDLYAGTALMNTNANGVRARPHKPPLPKR